LRTLVVYRDHCVCTVFTVNCIIRLFRTMSIPTTFRLFRVLTSEHLGRQLPVFTLLHAETITSLKLNLFSFFICSCQHQRKTICLYVYFSDITLTVRYRTPVFTEFLLCILTSEVQCRLIHRIHVIWRTKITIFWRNGNDWEQPYWQRMYLDRILTTDDIHVNLIKRTYQI
jgi:hypothetical protein